MSGQQSAGDWTPLDGVPPPEADGILDTAKNYVAANLSVISIRTDGSKSPAVGTWKAYQERQPNQEELRQMFRGNRGIAVLGGAISGNLEILDFDKPGVFDLWREFAEQLQPGLADQLPRVRTPAGGDHVYYRCQEISGSVKLAKAATPFVDRTGKKKTVLIETKGEGGYVLAPGCPITCHEAGEPYELLSGSLSAIPTVSVHQRTALHSAARALNQVAPKEDRSGATGANTDRPGDEFNARGPNWSEILQPHGWIRKNGSGDTEYWRRPGKDDCGISATTGHCGDMLYVFSSNAAPFDADRAYDKFGALVRLEYGGDHGTAAKDLGLKGYGRQRQGQKKDVSGAHPVFQPYIKAIIENNRRLQGLFEGRGKTWCDEEGERLPTSSTGYDMSLALELARKGVVDVEALAGAIWARPDDAARLRGAEYVREVACQALKRMDPDIEDDQFRVDELKIYNSDPPSYKLVINGIGIRMSSTELLNPHLFRKRVLERTRRIPIIPSKPAVWQAIVNQWLDCALIIDLPPEASIDTMLRERIAYLLASLAKGETLADMERGRVVATDDGLAFRTRPFLTSLNSSESKNQVETNELCRHLRSMGYVSKTIRIKDSEKPVRVWLAPSDAEK